MSDCANVTMRELLPDLLHGRLQGPEAAAVDAHLVTCELCRSELEVLRAVRVHLSAVVVPPVDRARIARALPRPPQRTAKPLRWRWAAAITMFVLGGTTVATAVRSFTGDEVVVDTAVAPPASASVDTPVATTAGASRADRGAARMTAGGDVGDLADEDLERLIGALESIEMVPLAEPEASSHGRWVSGSTGGN